MCLEVSYVDGAPYFNVSVTASQEWVFTTVEYWIGENETAVPIDADGTLDYDNFPVSSLSRCRVPFGYIPLLTFLFFPVQYYWCYSSGVNQWNDSALLKWDYNCEDALSFNLSMIAQVTFWQFENGTLVPDSEVTLSAQDMANDFHGWFDFELQCECPPMEPCEPWNQTLPVPLPELPVPPTEICIESENDSFEECHDILAGDSLVVGSVCTKIVDENGNLALELSFSATESWVFVTHEIWVGENISDVPVDSSGDLDTENFPYYWVSSCALVAMLVGHCILHPHICFVPLLPTFLCIVQF